MATAVKNGLDTAIWTADGNDHLADILMWEVAIGGTAVKRQGIAAVQAYTQVTKRTGKFSWEMVQDNSGPAVSALDVTAFTIDSNLYGSLQNGTISLKIPPGTGDGIADVYEFAQAMGARDVSIDAELHIPSATTTMALLTSLKSGTVTDWTKANVVATLGGVLSFDYPMVIVSGSQKGERDGYQVVQVHMEQRGNPTTTPNSGSATSLLNVAFAGDGLITGVVKDKSTGATWTFTNGVIESMDVKFGKGELHKMSGVLNAQGIPTYA